MKTAIACLFLVLLSGCESPAHTAMPARMLAQVAAVHDGDTVTLVDGRRLRLAWVDAPELDQPGGREAMHVLQTLALGRYVIVVDRGRDAGGVQRAELLVNGAQDIGWLLIRSGNAWLDTSMKPQKSPRERELYTWAEREARNNRFGLWADHAVAPWQWRKQRFHHRACGDYTRPESPTIKVVAV